MRRLRERFPNELVVIGVHSGKFPAEHATSNIREAVLRHHIEHPVVNDAEFQIWRSYAVNAWPTVVLIDPLGRYIGTQPGEISAEDFIPIIEAMVAEFEREGQIDRRPLDLRPETQREPERPLAFPAKLALGPDGRLFVSDTGHHRILELALREDGLSAEVKRVFGSGEAGLRDGPPDEARFNSPHGLALSGPTEGAVSRLYVADTDNHAVRLIDLDTGEVRTVAGTGEKGGGALQLGEPTATPLRSPWAVLVLDQLVFIAMAGSHQIWLLLEPEVEAEPDAPRLIPFAGNGREALVDGPRIEASFNQPSDLALGFGHLLVADSEASAIRAISLDENPEVKTLVGQGLFEFGDIDGTGSEVRLQHPTGLAFAEGLIYIADTYNNKIKQLDPRTGEVRTLIGSREPGDADGSFETARFDEPEGVAMGGTAEARRLFIADTNNHLVRVADLQAREVRTLALRGLEHLAPAAEQRNQNPAIRLPPLEVDAGQVEITLDVAVPEGYKLNAEAPMMVQAGTDGQPQSHTFAASEPPTLLVSGEPSREMDLDLTVYYCEAEDQRLCLVHTARLVLPLVAVAGGTTQATVHYQVPAPPAV